MQILLKIGQFIAIGIAGLFALADILTIVVIVGAIIGFPIWFVIMLIVEICKRA